MTQSKTNQGQDHGNEDIQDKCIFDLFDLGSERIMDNILFDEIDSWGHEFNKGRY